MSDLPCPACETPCGRCTYECEACGRRYASVHAARECADFDDRTD